MGSGISMSRPPRNPVPEGKTRVCVAGYKISPYTGHARATAALIAAAYPDTYESWFYFDSSDNFYGFLKETFDSVPFPPHLKGHASSPFVWLERGATNEITPIGGDSHLSEWALAQKDLVANEGIKNHVSSSGLWGPTFHNGESAPQSTANITITPAPTATASH